MYNLNMIFAVLSFTFIIVGTFMKKTNTKSY